MDPKCQQLIIILTEEQERKLFGPSGQNDFMSTIYHELTLLCEGELEKRER